METKITVWLDFKGDESQNVLLKMFNEFDKMFKSELNNHKDCLNRLWSLCNEIASLPKNLNDLEKNDVKDRILCEMLEEFRFNLNKILKSIEHLNTIFQDKDLPNNLFYDAEIVRDTFKYYQNILIQRKILLLSVKLNDVKSIKRYKELIEKQNVNGYAELCCGMYSFNANKFNPRKT